jgi:hypothetical protein
VKFNRNVSRSRVRRRQCKRSVEALHRQVVEAESRVEFRECDVTCEGLGHETLRGVERVLRIMHTPGA